MDSSTSSENIIQQVESLKKELDDCRKTLETIAVQRIEISQLG